MRNTREAMASLRVSGIAIVAVVAMAASGPPQGGTPASTALPDSVARPAHETRQDLQDAFGNEVNAKARYQEYAKIADREGYPYVARLFRACARAEQVHADEHVHAIAWNGDAAKAFLERLVLGTTAENLRAAIGLESYEANERYPAMLAEARAEAKTPAVRSMNFALAAEREHARLLTDALETLEQRPAARTFYVCPTCGKTTVSLDFTKCPNCFTSARRFIAVD